MWPNVLSNFRSFWMWNGLNCWHIFIPIELLHNCLNLGFLFFQEERKSSCSERLVCNFKWSLKMKFLALCRKAHISSELFYLPFIIFLFFKSPFLSTSIQYFYIVLEMHTFFIHFHLSSSIEKTIVTVYGEAFSFYTIFFKTLNFLRSFNEILYCLGILGGIAASKLLACPVRNVWFIFLYLLKFPLLRIQNS